MAWGEREEGGRRRRKEEEEEEEGHRGGLGLALLVALLGDGVDEVVQLCHGAKKALQH